MVDSMEMPVEEFCSLSVCSEAWRLDSSVSALEDSSV